jgi:hypothetical protein
MVVVLDRLGRVLAMMAVVVVTDMKVIVEGMQAVVDVEVEVVEAGEWNVGYDQRRNGYKHD